MGRRRLSAVAPALVAGLLLAAPAPLAGAATPGVVSATTIADPLEGLQHVPDLGATVVTVTAENLLTVRTEVVARPPAGWGGCFPLTSGICMPAETRVTWYLDWRTGGSAAAAGADARVVAAPAWGRTAWSADAWSDETGHWSGLAAPEGATDVAGVRWTAPAAGLGIGPKVRTLLLRAVARIVPLDPLGQPLPVVVDETAAGAIPLAAFQGQSAPDAPEPRSPPAGAPAPGQPGSVPAPTTPAAKRRACARAATRLADLDRRIRRAAKAATSGPAARRRAARRDLRRLRVQRNAALVTKRRTCATASQPPSR